MFRDDFAGNISAFDAETTEAYAEIFAARRRAGRTVATIDIVIADKAQVHGACVVTRNVADSEGSGITIVNPWVL
jgi:predicted nucleic acid-binding protein